VHPGCLELRLANPLLTVFKKGSNGVLFGRNRRVSNPPDSTRTNKISTIISRSVVGHWNNSAGHQARPLLHSASPSGVG
jgi:hypothetical protein